jgi:lactoylglutathione lyase
VPSADDVRAAEERLRARGAAFAYDGIVAHREGAHSGGIFFEDPDGTRLEIYTAEGVTGSAPAGGRPACGFF